MADEHGGDLDGLDPATLAVRDLIGASRELVGRMAQVMRTTATDMAAIDALGRHGPMGVVQLANRLGIRPASATLLADRLERAGHVERVRDTQDRRRVVLTATTTARAATVQAWLPAIHEIDDVCRTLTDTRRTFVLGFLHQVTAATERSGQTG